MKKQDKSKGKQGSGKGGRKARRTPDVRRARKNLGDLARMWNELTEEQRTAWHHRARGMRSRVRNGRSYRLDGQKLFLKINSVLLLLGREPRTEPPPEPRFGPNPVGELQITDAGAGLALNLRVKGTLAEEVMVYASPPRNAGRRYCGDFRFLGLLPDPVEHWSDITRLYVRKFGVPPRNTRVFIRVWQVVDGWENKAAMQITSALVPARRGEAGGPTGARQGGKRG